MPTFASPAALLLILLLPPILWWSRRRGRRPALRFSSTLRTVKVQPSLRQRALVTLPILRVVALLAIIIALARPQAGIGEIRTTADGVAIMLVVDRSLSMQDPMSDEDPTSRINVVKEVCEQFIRGGGGLDGRPEDLIGLVTFGRYGDTVCPLVRVHDTLVKLVDGIELADRPYDQGTAIGEGIALAAARLQEAEKSLRERNEDELDPEFEIKSKVIVLMTDGEENVREIPAPQAAQLAADWGVKIYTIGIGSTTGYITRQTPLGPQRIRAGATFNEGLLRQIAEMTGGAYFVADDADALREIYEHIDDLEKTRIESTEYTSYEESFMPWAILGGVALLLELALASLWLRRVP